MLWNDLRYTLRTLKNAPVFTLVAVLSLALGIGANTAIFSLVDAVLLRLLPVRAPEELVVLERVSRQDRKSNFSYPLYEDFRDRCEAFSGAIARDRTGFVMSAGSEMERVSGEMVSENYFSVLGVGAILGRVFAKEDARAPVAVLSYGFWQRRFGRDPSIIGKAIHLNREPFTVIGVSEAGFNGTEIGFSPDIRLPILLQAQVSGSRDLIHTRTTSWLEILARRKSGVSLAQAQSSAGTLFQHLMESDARDVDPRNRHFLLDQRLALLPGARGLSEFRTFTSGPLLALMSIVGLVLLIACANVANLLLARAAARRREIAMRLALGASRARLVRQFLTEGIVLAVWGASLGVLLAIWTCKAVPRVFTEVGQPISLDLNPDVRTLGFLAAVSLLTGILCGLGAAFQGTRANPGTALKSEDGMAVRAPRFSLGKLLVATQVALSVLLLIGAGLFVRSLEKLRGIDLGFEPEHVLMFGVGPVQGGSRQQQMRSIYPQLLDRMSTIPGVRRASIASQAVLSGAGSRSTVSVEGYQPKSGEDMNLNDNMVTPGYFATLGIPLLAGRDFTHRDTEKSPKVAIVNETMARYFFGNRNPIGKRFAFGANQPPDIEIVGLVKDSKYRILRENMWRTVYIPSVQGDDSGMTIVMLRAAGDPAKLAPLVRSQIRALDPSLFIYVMRTLPQQIEINLFSDKLIAKLAGFFAFLALLLASVGLYGVMSHAVTRRTREIGIRMTLGAKRTAVLWLVTKETLLLLGIGMAIGIPAAFALTRLASSLLYEVSPADPIATAAAAVLLTAVALLATWIPARRATKIYPMDALRHE